MPLLHFVSFISLVIITVSADVRCRYNVTAPEKVSYYTCTELALKYRISIEQFFVLNPLLDPDCTSIQAGERYCVAGNVVPTTTNGSCRPELYASCLGYSGGQCCNSGTWKCGNAQNDCRAGTCISGLCEVKDPSSYSLDGKCGIGTGDKKCGGKWGSCCGRDNTCGDGPESCGIGNCQYGNCTQRPAPTTPTPPAPSTPFFYYGNTTDGRCGPEHDHTVCNVAWGFCCASTGKCGDGPPFCGVGCQPAYGNCTTGAVTPTPKPGDPSPDGTCGSTNGYVCKGSTFGDCCSSSGFCGSTDGHCKAGCQTKFGECTGGNISLDGTCGGVNGYTCADSTFGGCCSSSGYCGSTPAHCQAGCQSKFGSCSAGDKTSPDGSCGGSKGYTCGGSDFGDCCSSSGYCGTSTAHCSAGCQPKFGTCSSGGSKVSTDGTCGGSNGLICTGSGFGDCCSSYGYCGTTSGHCSTGCQRAFGTCTDTGTPSGPGSISPDGSCGGTKTYTCAGSAFGGCCSSGGFCGSTVAHCAQGCQTSFSNTCITSNIPTLDGTCGPKNGARTCAGGPFDGQCCGASGFCGATTAHCGSGCLRGYGRCN